MKFLSSLDAKDRTLLLWCMGIALGLCVAIGFLMPRANNNKNPVPSTYLSGQHGARAAYEMLLGSGYDIERWERPLSELAVKAGPDTVVIFADPLSREAADVEAVRTILERGGRVLATGYLGGRLLPGEAASFPEEFTDFAACKLEPEGIDPLTGTGEVWMTPSASWSLGNPAYRVEYSCNTHPAVVEYDWQKGHVVWWAASTPLENGSISRAHNVDLLLNSLGERAGHHFYWDESLHGDIRSVWSYATGPSLTMLWWGMPVLGLLVILSFSRRSGPVRDLPAPARATPIEFLEALGSLYRKAGAASTVLAIAWERFRRQTLKLCGQRGSQINASDLAAVIRRRFPSADAQLEADLTDVEQATWGETIEPRKALKLIQTLHHHRETLKAAAKASGYQVKSDSIHSSPQERAS